VRAALSISNRQRALAIDSSTLRRLARTLLRNVLGQEEFDLGIYLVGSPEMARLNEMFIRHAGPTDVITFDYGPEITPSDGERSRRARCAVRANEWMCPPPLHGEIFICTDVAVEQARRFRARLPDELVRYLIHGVLHLRGYKDSKPGDRRAMKREEDRLLRRLSHGSALSQLIRGRFRARRIAGKPRSSR
jgi:probable rRNA maturation factor